MTITYKGTPVCGFKKVPATGALLGALMGGPRTTSFELHPDPEDPLQDLVVQIGNWGSLEFRGPQIIEERACREHKISWYNNRERFF